MQSYKKFKLLKESLDQNLGLTSPSSLGIRSPFDFEEAKRVIEEAKKKKKKMLGDAMPTDDDVVDDEEDDSEDGAVTSDEAPEASKDGGCDCDCGKDKEPEVSDLDDEEEPAPAVPPMEGKKCKKCSKGMKKNASKKMKKENVLGSMFGQNWQAEDYVAPQLGSDEFRASFLESISRQFGDPDERFSDGVDDNYGEDVLLSPNDHGLASTEARSGEFGFAPYTRIGGSEETVQQKAVSGWEAEWEPLAAERFIEEQGMAEEFKKWIGERMLQERRIRRG